MFQKSLGSQMGRWAYGITLLVGAASILTMFQSGEALARGVFTDANGRDTRTDMLSSRLPWSAIGKLFLKSGKSTYTCTATLVGRRVIVTAAHCVLRNGKISSVTFRPNFKQGRSATQAQSVYTRVGTTDPDRFPAADWAVVVLSNTLGDAYGFLGAEQVSSIAPPMKIRFAGYSRDYRGGDTAGADSCQIQERIREGYFGHDCSTMPGASGGPLIREESGHFYVTGVHVRGDSDWHRTYTHQNSNQAVWNDQALDTIHEFRRKYP